MYMKELSLVLSRSYGPGRYDPQYEEEGLDYPIGYVRWTEKRNMEAFLDCLPRGRSMSRPSSRGVVRSSREARPSGVERYRAYTVLLEYPIWALIAIPAVSSDSPQSVRRRPVGGT
jgi:hypothetical protein